LNNLIDKYDHIWCFTECTKLFGQICNTSIWYWKLQRKLIEYHVSSSSKHLIILPVSSFGLIKTIYVYSWLHFHFESFYPDILRNILPTVFLFKFVGVSLNSKIEIIWICFVLSHRNRAWKKINIHSNI